MFPQLSILPHNYYWNIVENCVLFILQLNVIYKCCKQQRQQQQHHWSSAVQEKSGTELY